MVSVTQMSGLKSPEEPEEWPRVTRTYIGFFTIHHSFDLKYPPKGLCIKDLVSKMALLEDDTMFKG